MDYGYFDIMNMNAAGMPAAEPKKQPQRPTDRFPAETPLGMAYVPFQTMNTMYDPEEGLERGTIFPELDFPLQYTEEGMP
ncbi:MAG: spore coat associated protein CotJA [Oscillospiraceae bacterium]|nr:spore coat associated protein CotJA [Oscillospiraceae bacterium]